VDQFSALPADATRLSGEFHETQPSPAPGLPVENDCIADPSDLIACRTLLRGGSRSFFAASYLLPGHIARPASALYAFCRVADDAVDTGDARRGLEQLHERLEGIYAGRPADHPADRAFTDVVDQLAIPRALPAALLEGFAWDVQERSYETLADVLAYAARVAGTVGAMMTLVMGQRDPGVLSRACDLGAAMQLTNIARDVGEDAANGRLYLPREWLVESGIDPDAWLASPRFSPALGEVIQRLLNAAEMLYRRAAVGIARLPRRCRPGIHAARLLYAEIGNELSRSGLDSVSRRAVVPAGRKLRLCIDAVLAAMGEGKTRLDSPPLTETRFLVEAVHGTAPDGLRGVPELPTTERLLRDALHDDVRGWSWAMTLFTRLEARQRRGNAMHGEGAFGAAHAE
jgi:phytoene synthase